MLSQNAIDNLIQPIIDRQEAINNYVVELICKRIKEIGELSPSDIYKLERLLKMGGDVRQINAEIAKTTNLQVADIKKMIKTVAANAYQDVKPYYDYRHRRYIPFEKNIALQRIVKAVQTQTADSYINLSKAQAFMLRDRANPRKLIPTSISKTYYSAIDEAVQATQSGVLDYHTAMRRTVKQLADSGIRYVEYESENGKRHTQRLDTAVHRNLQDGIRAINQGVQDEVGKQFGADGKEISVHAMSAPDHEPIQGHQFTNQNWENLQNRLPFDDVQGNHFEAINRPIGVWNCKHFAYSIIIGVDKPTYTNEQLQDFIAKNNAGYTTSDGKHLTMYECTQVQRQIETEIRYAREKQMVAVAAGDRDLALECQAKVADLMKEYQAFSKNCGLKPKPDRFTVEGYRKIS